jgi:hypothetical protein
MLRRRLEHNDGLSRKQMLKEVLEKKEGNTVNLI